MRWRLIQSGYLDGYTNMALDEAIFTLMATGHTPPTLRLYGWRPPAISIGYFQKLEEIKLAKKIDLVRRLTGGGAILHGQELTYCLVATLKDATIPKDISASYKVICRAIMRGLQALGIAAQIRGDEFLANPAGYSQSNGVSNRTVSKEREPFFCFDRPSKDDIIYKGKKLMGSAQRRKNGILLHHGSILLNEQNLESSTSVNSILGKKIGFEELSKNIAEGFEKELSIKLFPSELTGEESKLSRQLVNETYLE